jgi:hypothetical protein
MGGSSARAPSSALSDIGLLHQADGTLKSSGTKLDQALGNLERTAANSWPRTAATSSATNGLADRLRKTDRPACSGPRARSRTFAPGRPAELNDRNSDRQSMEPRGRRPRSGCVAQYQALDSNMARLSGTAELRVAADHELEQGVAINGGQPPLTRTRGFSRWAPAASAPANTGGTGPPWLKCRPPGPECCTRIPVDVQRPPPATFGRPNPFANAYRRWLPDRRHRRLPAPPGRDALRRLMEPWPRPAARCARRDRSARAGPSAGPCASSKKACAPAWTCGRRRLAQDLHELYGYVTMRLTQANLRNDEAAARRMPASAAAAARSLARHLPPVAADA